MRTSTSGRAGSRRRCSQPACTRGDRVAFLDKNGPAFFEVQLGAAKLGAVMVAVNWRLAPPEIAFTLNDARAPVLVVGEEFLAAVDVCRSSLETVEQVVTTSGVGGDEYEAWIAAHPATDPGFEAGPTTSACSSTRRARPACRRASCCRSGACSA